MKRTMNNLRNIVLIVLVAVLFGALMGYRANLPFGWMRAVIAALAFILLGWLVSYLSAKRRG
jgi:hypothetical protein